MISNAKKRNYGEYTDFLFDKCSVFQNIVQIIAAHVIDISNIILGHSVLFPFLVSPCFFGMVKNAKHVCNVKLNHFTLLVNSTLNTFPNPQQSFILISKKLVAFHDMKRRGGEGGRKRQDYKSFKSLH